MIFHSFFYVYQRVSFMTGLIWLHGAPWKTGEACWVALQSLSRSSLSKVVSRLSVFGCRLWIPTVGRSLVVKGAVKVIRFPKPTKIWINLGDLTQGYREISSKFGLVIAKTVCGKSKRNGGMMGWNWNSKYDMGVSGNGRRTPKLYEIVI